MNTTRPQHNVLGSALRRFGVIGAIVGILCGYLAAQIVEKVSSTTYTAQGSFVVPLQPELPAEVAATVADPRPNSAYEATQLAQNYAVVVAQDQAVLGAVTGPTGLAVADLAQNIEAVALPSSSVVRVTFTADEEAPVLAYFTAMRDLVVAPQSVTPYIPAGNLQPLRLPEEVTKRSGLAPVAPYVGAFAGLLLGLAAAVMLERLLAQVRTPNDVRALVPWPVLQLRGRVGQERYETLVLRTLTGTAVVRRVAVVTAAGMSVAAGNELTEQLRRAEVRLRRAGRLSREQPPIVWDSLGRLLDDSSVERSVQDADAVVLAMPRKARLRPATAALQRLTDLAAAQVLVVLGSPGRGAAGQAPADTAGVTASAPVGEATEDLAAGTRSR